MRFAGQQWRIVPARRKGPGPNLFLPDNVRLTQKGLELSIRKVDGHWACAEVVSEALFGYGCFRFTLAAGVDRLDPQAVLGLFCYRDPQPGAELSPEIDIEISRWGDVVTPPLTYALWSGQTGVPHLSERHGPLPAGPTRHSFEWGPEGISYLSENEGGQMLAHTQLNFADPSLNPPPPLRVHLNLWLYQGKSPARAESVLITAFEHIPREENPARRV